MQSDPACLLANWWPLTSHKYLSLTSTFSSDSSALSFANPHWVHTWCHALYWKSESQTCKKRSTQSSKGTKEQAHCYRTLGQSQLHREVCKSAVRQQEETGEEEKVSAKVSGSLGTTMSWEDKCTCSEWTRIVKDRVSETTRAGSAKAVLSRKPGTPEQPQAALWGCRLYARNQGRQAGRQAGPTLWRPWHHGEFTVDPTVNAQAHTFLYKF